MGLYVNPYWPEANRIQIKVTKSSSFESRMDGKLTLNRTMLRKRRSLLLRWRMLRVYVEW